MYVLLELENAPFIHCRVTSEYFFNRILNAEKCLIIFQFPNSVVDQILRYRLGGKQGNSPAVDV